MQNTDAAGTPAKRQSGGALRALKVLLVLALAIAVAYAFLKYIPGLQPEISWPFAALSALGGGAVFAWLLGVIALPQRETDHQFKDYISDATGDAEVVTDAKGRVVYSNAAYNKLIGKAGVARPVGMDVLYAGYPDLAEPVYQLAGAAREGKPMQRDVRVGPNSSVPGAMVDQARWLRFCVFPIAGETAGAQTLWRMIDITADRNAQESAFSRLQFIITYLDNAPAGFFSTLPDGRVDYINATLAEWLNIDLANGQSGKMKLPDVVGEDAAKMLLAIAPLASGSRTEQFKVSLPVKAGNSRAATIMQRADFDGDGKALPFRSMVLLNDAAGADIAGLQAHWFENLADVSPLGMALVSPAGDLRKCNVGFLGLSPLLKLQGTLSSALSGVDLKTIADALAAVVATPNVRQVVDVVFANGAEPRAAQLTFCKFEKTSDDILVFSVDRTENKSLEVQLAQSQKMQAVGQLASGIAHDFNNVLTPIIGFADLLLAKMRPTDAAFADIMNIKQNAVRAANLVRQLLAFSRKTTMQPKVHLLTEALSDLGSLFGRVLGEKVSLDVSHARDLGHVMVDINQFEQVIINLAVNARDAMPQGGRMGVKTYNVSRDQAAASAFKMPEGEYVVCEISDTGTGIPKDILEKIWEPFFSTKEVGKGTGLGLSMVYGIVKQTGGFIFCDSEVGKGTTFSIYLPRVYPEKAVEALPAEKAEVVRADFTGRGRILVVEDEDSVRAFAVRALASRGYTVVEADSGERALEVIAEDESGFELILSDVVMPEMDGPTMLSEIRKQGMTTKVIFMSGYAEDAFERNLENPDDFAFIQKPFSLKQLVEKVKDVMG